MSLSALIINHNIENNQEDIRWWSKKLNIPVSSFIKPVTAISKASKQKKRTLENGTCALRLKGKDVWKMAEKIRKSIKNAPVL